MADNATKCKFFHVLFVCSVGIPATVHAVDVTMDGYLLQLSVGNGITNDFGPTIMDDALPLDTTQQFSQSPSSGFVQYMLQSFDQEQTIFEFNSTLAVGRAGPNEIPITISDISFEIRPHEPVLVDLEAHMSYDLPSAFMTATSSISISNFDLGESVGGSNLFPGVSFEGDPIADSTSAEFNDLILEPGYLYRMSYSLLVTAFTDLFGPVGTAQGFGRITIRPVPEPASALLLLAFGAHLLRKRRR